MYRWTLGSEDGRWRKGVQTDGACGGVEPCDVVVVCGVVVGVCLVVGVGKVIDVVVVNGIVYGGGEGDGKFKVPV